MRMLVNGSVTDLVDEYIHISETTCLEAMVRFSTVMVNLFRKVYLGETNVGAKARVLARGESG